MSAFLGSAPPVVEELVDEEGTETLQPLGLVRSLPGLGDEDVGQALFLDVALVTLDPLKERQLALSPPAPADVLSRTRRSSDW